MSDRRQQDWRHLETVARILEAIVQTESNTGRAIRACVDAKMALGLGLAGGLTPRRIANQRRRAMAELAKAEGANG